MSKKKTKSNDRLWNQIEAQGERLKKLISMFYPDGVRDEFAKVPQVIEFIKSLPTLQRFSENKEVSERYYEICEDSYEKESGNAHIKFGGYYNFHGYSCIGFNTYIMFKTAPDGTPIYLKDELESGDVRPEFLVDGENKEAYLVLDDDNSATWKEDSFIKLSEFHAILYRTNLETGNWLCFTISFSQEEKKYAFERIYDMNMCLLDGLFMFDGLGSDDGTPPPSISEDDDIPAPSNDKDAPAIITEKDDTSFPANSEDDETEIGDSTKE